MFDLRSISSNISGNAAGIQVSGGCRVVVLRESDNKPVDAEQFYIYVRAGVADRNRWDEKAGLRRTR
jgi:hypothetical protein